MTKSEPTPPPSFVPSDIVSASPDQILYWLQKVVNHDLPNQLLAVRGWITLLQTEESEQLSESGRSLMHRLNQATGKAQHAVELIAEFARLSTAEHRVENLSVLSFIPEVQRAAQQRTGAVRIDWDLSVQPVSVRAAGKLLVKAMVEIIALTAKRSDAESTPRTHPVQLGAKQTSDGTAVWIKAANEILEKDTDKRLEYLFARETAAMFGGTFTIQTADGEPDCFLFQFPGYTAVV